ncbi:MAG: LysR family transcriptional regulator [Paracoccaceae bacterium]
MIPYTPLRSVIEVMRTGSVSQAALRLGLTQPAVSGHIRVIEAALGHALFDRVARGMQATRLGAELARAISGPVDDLDAAYQGFVARNRDVAGVVRIVGPAPYLAAHLRPALAALQARGLTVQVETGGQTVIYDRLLSGAVDLAITASRPASAEIGWVDVGVEALVPVASQDWIAAHGATLAKAAAQPPLAYDADLPLIRDVLAAEGLTAPAPLVMIDDLSLLRGAAAAGMGWTVLPDYLLAGTALRQLEMKAAPPVNALRLAWLKTALRTPRVAFAREAVLEGLRRAQENPPKAPDLRHG